MTSDEMATTVVARLRSRVQGAILGLALGEALAAPTQWARVGSFTPVRDLLGGGPYDLPRGSWSDETAMMLASARSLVQVHASDVEDQREALRRWQRFGEHSASGECLGITASVAAALTDGAADLTRRDGADALVRIVPWVIHHYASDPQDPRWSEGIAAVVALTSHEPDTVHSTLTYARMLHAALRGASREAIVSLWPDTIPADALTPRVLARATSAFAAADQWKTAVLDVVNLGGDSDAAAAVCGALAGAHHGVGALPAAWREALVQRSILEETADALLTDLLIGLA